MPTIPEQLGSLSILDSLKHAAVPGTMSNLPWQTAVGSWSEAAGWSPASFLENAPTNTRSGLYINTGKVSGNYGLGLKKTTGSLAVAARQFEVWLFYQGAAAASGYQLRVIAEASGKVQYKLTKWVEGTGTPLIESAKELTFAENDSFFLARVGNKLGIYHRTGEGTPELVGSEVEDTTFTEGFVGFGGNGSNPRLINLQGGALTAATAAPEVTTEEPSEVGKEKAKLNGQVDANSGTTKFFFQLCRAEVGWVLPEANTSIAVATDGTWIYFANNQTGFLGRVKLDGTELNSKWVSTEISCSGIAVQGSFIYYTDTSANRIGKVKTDGTEQNKAFITTGGEPANIAVNATNIYWTNTGLSSFGIGRATLAGGEVTKEWLLAGESAANGGIAIDSGHIYWLGFEKIGRATLAGGSIEKSWVTGVKATSGLALDAEALYFGNTTEGYIGRVKIDGTELLSKWLRGPANARKFFVTAEGVYWGAVSGTTKEIGRAKFVFAPSSKEGSGGSSAEPVAVNQVVEGLTQGSEYALRIRASNEKGETFGTWKSFLTAGTGTAQVLVGGALKIVRRWVLVKGELKQK